ncbi:MAG: hypothetical protein HQL19_01340 [Candidatus Omnitrophica bacterium]|nr:hypothetical protein [Candidatus Omnitrophota bacterium]
MLSEQDKKDMLADAADPKRRAAFRAAKERQARTHVDGTIDCAFLDEMLALFPHPPSKSVVTTPGRWLL